MAVVMRKAHGGTVFQSSTALGIEEGSLLDLSASINPLGIPRTALMALRRALPVCVHYPDTESSLFVQVVSERFGLEREKILAANGSTELIYLLPLALRPRTVLVTAPAFSEYERAALRAGAKVRHVPLRKSQDFRIEPGRFIDAMQDAEMAFLCNPNNPTGHALSRDEVLEVARAAKRLKCVLVVDEAFADFVPECSAINVDNPYLVVLRSMTKFYAMAGLRMGYGVFPKRVADRLRSVREPWTVNTLAERAGAEALRDDAFAVRSMKLMRREKARMEVGLWQLGIRPLTSDANFYLLQIKNGQQVADRLLKEEHILVRQCGNFHGLGSNYIRIAVRSREENMRFLEALGRHV